MATTADSFFGDWAPPETEARGPLRHASRDMAEREFARLMLVRADRAAALTVLASAHGVRLDTEDAPLMLGRWLVAALNTAGLDAIDGPDAGRWSGLAGDVALWLGERIIATATSGGVELRWTLYTGIKKSTGYQRAVLTGFQGVDDPRYYVDIAHFVGAWFELAARRRPARPDFFALIEASALADATPQRGASTR